MGEPEGELVGGVVLQHVEDETLLDRLPHRIAWNGCGLFVSLAGSSGLGRRPKSSIVLALGVAVKAT